MPSVKSDIRRVRCEVLGTTVALPARPERVVSLVSGFTEAIFAMGLEKQVAAVSKYCSRYVRVDERPLAGDYLHIDEAVLQAVKPDLVLMTGGVQLGVARKLSAQGWPVFVLPLPDSFFGILENIRRIGALLGEMPAALALSDRLASEAEALRASGPSRRPRVYAELCFGRHARMAGGLTFAHDIVTLAGGDNIFAHEATGYLDLNFAAVEAARPDVVVIFSEEDDHPVDATAAMQTRGWTNAWPFKLIESGIRPGRNLIHDGPTILKTARWLREEMFETSDFA